MSNNDHGATKYLRELKPVRDTGRFDVYAVLVGFNVVCPAIAHCCKKLLCAGIRGKGDKLQDLLEARVALNRAIELAEGENENVPSTAEHDSEPR